MAILLDRRLALPLCIANIGTMSDKVKTPNFENIAKVIKKDLLRYAGRSGVYFFKARFRDQAWLDKTKEPWEQRMSDPGRAILMGRGYLRDSIRVVSKSDSHIEFGTDVPYAKIHNLGGTIKVRVTKKSRRFFWFMYHQTGEEKWRAMALTPKTHFNVNIPKRQFIGHSDTFIARVDDWVVKKIVKEFKESTNDV